jgi:hypothetical protein
MLHRNQSHPLPVDCHERPNTTASGAASPDQRVAAKSIATFRRCGFAN